MFCYPILKQLLWALCNTTPQAKLNEKLQQRKATSNKLPQSEELLKAKAEEAEARAKSLLDELALEELRQADKRQRKQQGKKKGAVGEAEGQRGRGGGVVWWGKQQGGASSRARRKVWWGRGAGAVWGGEAQEGGYGRRRRAGGRGNS